ncbi:hypothetical protein DBV05_g11200 [Lasiodiplodia theobromae]|uniref:Alpha/beta hydrolase fold-3 domain-containing protein n=1 Tax=Lasiodiplodia theobromae TaxID=45133 RepID=A0A5N5CXP5_9PEZI|nr:hypothetical protein DBV05_g11200 [Lasiodiplodia theobromae]
MPPRPADQVRLSLIEKVKLVLFYAVVITKTCGSALTAPFAAPANRSKVYKRHVAYSLVRHLFSNSNTRIDQAITEDTDSVYYQWAKKHKVATAREVLPDGTEAFWIGSKDAKTVLLFFHGGGFNLPALPAHINFAARLVDELNPPSSSSLSSANFAVLFLQYDFGPWGHYPRQLAQAAALYKHVVEDLRIPNILIGGDSAGGNISISLLSHLLHPHPDASVPRIDVRSVTALKGALLISPWADPFGTEEEYPSLKRNEFKDLLHARFLKRWADGWVDGKPLDAYNRPTQAPKGWWAGVDKVLERFLLVVGADDVLVDGALKFAETFRKEWRDERDATVVVFEDEGHISGVMDPDMGFKPEEVRMWVQIRDWMKGVVGVSDGQ